MKKLSFLGMSILFVFCIISCVSISMPDVIRSSEIMPASQGYLEPVETLFPITIEQFQDSRPDKKVVGYQSKTLGGSNSVIVDKDISSILETIVTRELGFKGIKADNSIFILKGSVQRMAIGNMPGAQAGYSVLGELSVELTIYNTRKNASVWSKTFAGKGAGDDYKAVLAQTLKELTDNIRKDDSIVKVKNIYITALAEQPAETKTALTKKIKKKKTSAGAKSDVDTPPSIVAKSDIDELPIFVNEHKIIGDKDIAIVIGIEKYQGLPKSDYSSSDAKLIKSYFKSLGFAERNIELITDERATKSSIEKSLEAWLPNRVKKDSRVIVYYSGHGAPEPKTGDAYIVPYDGDPNYLEVTGYPLKRLYDNLGKLQVAEVVVLLDSCFSGAGGRSVLAKGARPLVMMTEGVILSQNMAVLSATQGTQISTSSPEKGHGVFTYYFLKALKDGKKTIAEIYEYIKPLVEDEAKQLNVQQSPSVSPDVEKLKGKFSLRR